MNISTRMKADFALLLVTIGWGASFMLTKNALDHLETYNFLSTRFVLAFTISALVFWRKMVKADKKTIGYGVLLGGILFSAYALQTVGLNYTTASKSAFITGFNVVLVPVMTTMINRKRLDLVSYLSVTMAFVGLAFLTLNQSVSGINFGDVLTFICSFVTALYIILVGKYSNRVDSIVCATVQIGIVALCSLVATFLLEKPVITDSTVAWVNIFVLAVVCTSGAFIIQMIAQKHTTPVHTALIFTGEPVFAGIFSFLFLGEVLGIKGIIGAVLILSGMLVSELDFKKIITTITKRSYTKKGV